MLERVQVRTPTCTWEYSTQRLSLSLRTLSASYSSLTTSHLSFSFSSNKAKSWIHPPSLDSVHYKQKHKKKREFHYLNFLLLSFCLSACLFIAMVEVKDQDMGEGMQCITHPYTKNPGGICALCLQEKLGKLVTSSFPVPKLNHLSSSSPPPKPFSPSTTSLALSLSSGSNGRDSTNNNNLPFLLAKKKKSMLAASSSSSSSTSSSSSANLIYKRSKSTAYGESFTQRKRSGFWSFLHLYSSKHQISSTSKKVENFSRRNQRVETTSETSKRVSGNRGIDVIVEEEDESPNKVVTETPTNSIGGSSFGRKVLRSRSVGCGSRSFSGDFFERISNGFGDCALRRIESQREATKVISNGGNGGGEAANAMNEMVKCGGIFGGFMIMTSSSTSSSSTVDHHHHNKIGNRSWGWAFASPMRAKTSTHRGRTITESTADNKNTSPNLDSIPSLLALKS